MRELSQLDFTTSAPGRYPIMAREQFIEGCDYIEALQTTSQRAFDEGMPLWVLGPSPATSSSVYSPDSADWMDSTCT